MLVAVWDTAVHPEVVANSAELKVEALHFYALHSNSKVLATQQRANDTAKAQGLMRSFGRLKPEYRQLLDDLDADMLAIASSENQ